MQVLDLRPPEITVKFSKGSTFNPIFFYLGKDNAVIDMTGYTARMQARATLNATDAIQGFDLTTENGGLSIVTGDAEISSYEVVPGAQGVQINVPAAVTSTVMFRIALFGIEITAPDGTVIPLVSGRLEADSELVK